MSKTTTKAIKPGEVLSEHAFYTVEKVGKKKVTLLKDSGEEVTLDREYVEKNLSSALSYTNTKEVTRTELAHIVVANPGVAMGLSYHKKPDQKEISEKICDLYPNKGGKMTSRAEFIKSVDATFSIIGNERVMYGRHNGHLNEQGRLSFIDMGETQDPAKSYDTRTRLVDTRTLNWVVVGGTKYTQKK